MKTIYNIIKYSGWIVPLASLLCMCLTITNLLNYTDISYWILAIPLYITFGTPLLYWLMAFFFLSFHNIRSNYSYNKALRLEKKIRRGLDSVERGINQLNEKEREQVKVIKEASKDALKSKNSSKEFLKSASINR